MALVSLLGMAALVGCGGKVETAGSARGGDAPAPSATTPPKPVAASGDAIVINGDVRGIALDGTAIYVIDVMGAVTRIPRAGGAPSRIASASSAYVYPGGLAVDDTHLYWTKLGIDDADGQVVRMPKTGGDVEVLADARHRPQQLAIDDARIFWADQGSMLASDGAVATMAKSGGAVTELASKQSSPNALVLHDDDVYWANGPTGSLNGSVQRVSKSGGAPALIVDARDTIGALVVAGDRVYWTESPQYDSAVVRSALVVGGQATDSSGSAGTGAALGLAGDKLIFAARRDPRVVLLEMAPGDATPKTVLTVEYSNAISYFAGQVGASDGATAYLVDVWFDPAAGARSVIHATRP